MAEPRTQQPALVDTALPGRARRYCRRCGRELTDPGSRLAGYGPDCDPANRPGPLPDHHVDQDPIPGT